MGISINGPSGIDTAYIIDSLTQLETSNRITPVEKQKAAYEVKIDAYGQLQGLVADLGAKAYSLNNITAFNLYSQSSSNESLVTLTGGTGAVAGSYSVGVYHTATAEKMVSTSGKVTSQSQALSSMSIGTGVISIDGAEITIDNGDTIQDLRMKINSATKADGSKIGVTATVIKASDTDFRLVLSSKTTGNTGIAYEDLGGATTLQDLGIITAPNGDNKGNTKQVLTSADSIQAAFDGMAVGGVIRFGGFDHDGAEVANTFVKTAGSTINDLLGQITKSYRGTATASVDGSGNLVLSDNITGTSQLEMDILDVNGTSHLMNYTVAGDEGAGVLSVGSDAYFSIDNMMLSSSKNAADGYIQGITLNLKKAAADEPVIVDVARDNEAVADKIQTLLDSYNSLQKFVKDKTSYGDSTSKTAKKGDLAGDMTASSVLAQFRSLFQQDFKSINSTYTSLSMVGIKTDYTTGQLTMDREAMTKALDANFDEVTNMFITTGTSSRQSIVYGRSTSDTQAGSYVLEEINAGLQARIQLSGDSTWYDSAIRSGDIVMFNDGPAKSLSLTLPVGSIPSGENATFSFSKGFGAIIKDLADKMNAPNTGLIATRQSSFRSSITTADAQIAKLTDSIASYKDRLTRQFSAMEQTLQKMKSQSNNMLAQLGMSTN
jgi:flagellar capping protein FliD